VQGLLGAEGNHQDDANCLISSSTPSAPPDHNEPLIAPIGTIYNWPFELHGLHERLLHLLKMEILRSDATALEHILVVLREQAVTVSGSPVPPFRACFLVAGCNNAIDFMSITPDMYGAIEFSTKSDGSDATQKLNIIQIKKLRSLIDWFTQGVTSSATRCVLVAPAR
jgi:hypothetical protein